MTLVSGLKTAEPILTWVPLRSFELVSFQNRILTVMPESTTGFAGVAGVSPGFGAAAPGLGAADPGLGAVEPVFGAVDPGFGAEPDPEPTAPPLAVPDVTVPSCLTAGESDADDDAFDDEVGRCEESSPGPPVDLSEAREHPVMAKIKTAEDTPTSMRRENRTGSSWVQLSTRLQ